MKLQGWVIFFYLLIVSGTTTHAQDDGILGGWPIEERCIGEPTTPPPEWTFDGTILMKGYWGLHAYQQDWDTPHVVAFVGGYLFGEAGLSPDKRWFAVPEGYRITTVNDAMMRVYHYEYVEEVVIYSTINPDDAFHMPWRVSYDLKGRFPQMHWLDEERLIYFMDDEENDQSGVFVINLQDRSFNQWDDGLFDIVFFGGWRSFREYVASPDMTRAVHYNTNALYDIVTGESIHPINVWYAYLDIVIWAKDSSQFIATIYDETDSTQQHLTVFDRDGQPLDTVLTYAGYAGPESLRIDGNTAWSEDGRYFSFGMGKVNTDTSNFYIADMQERRIIDTCLGELGEGAAWSLDNRQLALLPSGSGIIDLLVLDMDDWALYQVAHHDAGWRREIIGWRESE
jgi:hypothetical protein